MGTITGQDTGIRVYMTYDYEQFRPLKGNRDIDKTHIKRLIKSVTNAGMLVAPIIVNNKGEIVDGLHRRDTAKATEAPLYFIIVDDYDIEEMKILNQCHKGWTGDSFLSLFSGLGNQEYIKLKKYKDEFKLSLSTCISICSDTATGSGGVARGASFRAGKFAFTNSKAYDIGNQLIEISEYFPLYKRKTFINAFIHCSRVKGFNFNEFISKLKLPANHMKFYGTVKEMREEIHRVYNYRRRDNKKIELRAK